MPDTLITTLFILLSEIILIMIIIGVWVVLRRRQRQRSALAKDKVEQHQDLPADRPAHGTAVLDYLSSTITMTEELIAGLSADQHAEQNSLRKRLMALQAEKTLFMLSSDDTGQAALRDTIKLYYGDKDDPQQDHRPAANNEVIYETRIRNLEKFRAMFLDSQQQLKNSFNVINELKSRLGNMPDAEENRQLEDMVNELSLDNINMNKKLAEAQQHIQELLDELNETETSVAAQGHEQTDPQSDRIQTLEDENEFLCSQIQHLLQQEIENNTAMEEKIAELEAALQQASRGDDGIPSGST